ncbi:MAG: DUF2726 domain-containing protein [Lachnospiraceae bacterium]|nr:DUF2726 domain-containing protein [Lachnospiraceae bacterium]
MDLMKVKVLIAAVVITVVFLLIIFRMYFGRQRYPYRARPILTRREYNFYVLLQREASRRGLIVCPKVGVKDLLEVTSRRHYMKYFRQIAQKHIDFVICDRELRVLFAVELDDSSHDTEEAKKRDQFKDRAFKAARIPLRRIRDYDEASVWELFR